MLGPLVQERPGGVEQRATPAGWGIGGGGGGVGKSETSGILTLSLGVALSWLAWLTLHLLACACLLSPIDF